MNSDSQAFRELLNVSLLPLIELAGLSMRGGVPVIQTHDSLVDDLPKAHVNLELVDIGAKVLELLAHLGHAGVELLVPSPHGQLLAAGPDDHLEVLGVGEREAGVVALVDLEGEHGALKDAVEIGGAVDIHGGRDDLVLDDELALGAGLDKELGEGGVDRVLALVAVLEHNSGNL